MDIWELAIGGSKIVCVCVSVLYVLVLASSAVVLATAVSICSADAKLPMGFLRNAYVTLIPLLPDEYFLFN